MDDDRLVVLLDEDFRPSGTAPRDAVHTTDTPLHLAFSCYLLNAHGEVLITRRALAKRTWPGVWTNSFCGHPLPGEAIEDAVRRHAQLELGITLEAVREVLPNFRYRATDASGIVENELCPVFVATASVPIAANPAEVAEWAWTDLDDLASVAARVPQVLSPWAVLQLPPLFAALTHRVDS